MAEDTAAVTSEPTRVVNDTSDESETTAAEAPTVANPDPAETTTPSAGSGSRARWLLPAAIGFGVMLLVAALLVGYGAWRIAGSASARAVAADRLDEACAQLEQRLNRLVPPGATHSATDRAEAIRDENAAAELLVTELGRFPDRARSHRSLPGDWRALLAARERYADDLETGRRTGRPAFFVMIRDDKGTDRVERIIRRSPDSCDASARRLAAPDL